MSQQRNGMRTRRCGEKSKRGGGCRQHYFFDANAWFYCPRKYGPQNQEGDGRRNDPTVSASTHDFSLVMTELFRRGDNQRRMRSNSTVDAHHAAEEIEYFNLFESGILKH